MEQLSIGMFIMTLCMFSVFNTVNCNTPTEFLTDLLTTFHLKSPTLIFGDEEVPELCFTNHHVLCLQYVEDEKEATALLGHLDLLQQGRSQDAMIFVGGNKIKKLIEMISHSEQSMYRSPSPVFMPIEHQSDFHLSLDSNIIFFKGNNSLYTLTDQYAVKGDNQISQKIGIWTKDFGMKMLESIHRWNRRRDLQGSVIVNTLAYYKNWAEPVYDGQGGLVGSQALIPDRLYAVADSLNLSIDTKLTPDGQFGKLLENGSWTGCVGMVVRGEADVCTIGLAWTVAREERSLCLYLCLHLISIIGQY